MYLHWSFIIYSYVFLFDFDLSIVYLCADDHMLNYLDTLNQTPLQSAVRAYLDTFQTLALLGHVLDT
jgi:hypothetical protein